MTSTDVIPLCVSPGMAAIVARPPTLFLPHAKAAERFLDFFTANIRNRNTRRAYPWGFTIAAGMKVSLDEVERIVI
jgi:hypothetical protein